MANTMNIEQSIHSLCETLTKQWADKHGPTACPVTYSKGRKYFKLINDHGSQRSVYCFIDIDGNVYKSATWNTPAKGIRFHIDQLLEHPQMCDMFGGFLYKR